MSFVLALLVVVPLGSGCTSEPPPNQAPAPAATTATPPPANPAVEKADALLADLERRKTDQSSPAQAARPAQAPPSVPVVVEPGRPAAPQAQSQPAAGAPPAAAPANAAQTEAYWKDRMRVLQSRLDADNLALAAARANLQDISGSKTVDRDGKTPAAVTNNVFKAKTAVAQLTAAVQADQHEITNLQEEARRADVPPGWLRP